MIFDTQKNDILDDISVKSQSTIIHLRLIHIFRKYCRNITDGCAIGLAAYERSVQTESKRQESYNRYNTIGFLWKWLSWPAGGSLGTNQ